MANWHFEERRLEGHRFPLLLMVGDNGVEIRMSFARGWSVEYHSANLDANFFISRDPPSGGDTDMVLGPRCTVKMRRGNLSRQLEPDDCEPLAVNLRKVLRAHLQIPGAVPPKIERVRFLDPELQPFDD